MTPSSIDFSFFSTYTPNPSSHRPCMQDASAMYLEAVEVMEDEGQETMALDIFRQAIGENLPPSLLSPCLALVKGLLGLGQGYWSGCTAERGSPSARALELSWAALMSSISSTFTLGSVGPWPGLRRGCATVLPSLCSGFHALSREPARSGHMFMKRLVSFCQGSAKTLSGCCNAVARTLPWCCHGFNRPCWLAKACKTVLLLQHVMV